MKNRKHHSFLVEIYVDDLADLPDEMREVLWANLEFIEAEALKQAQDLMDNIL